MSRAAFISLLSLSAAAWANFSVDTTRIVMQEGMPKEALVVTNLTDAPIVVCGFVDKGEDENYCYQHQNVNQHFALLPNVFRIAAGSKQLTYVVPKAPGLPEDRESFFWLNLTDYISPDFSENNQYIHQRLKIFYRPYKIVGMDSMQALKQLSWKIDSRHSKGMNILIDNPSPFHASFAKISLLVKGKRVEIPTNKLDMVYPFDQKVIQFSINASSATIEYELIDDYGSTHVNSAVVR